MPAAVCLRRSDVSNAFNGGSNHDGDENAGDDGRGRCFREQPVVRNTNTKEEECNVRA